MAGWVQASDLSYNSKHAFRNWKNPWKAELEKKGLVDYSVSSPYRVAIPLTTLGSEDNKLMLTYTHRMPGESSYKGLLLFAKIPFD